MFAFKRKQIVVLTLVLMILVAGYLQYGFNKSSMSADKTTGKIGEAVYVNNELSEDKDKDKKDIKASKEANDFFISARLEKETVRSKDTSALKDITKDPNASREAKDKAYQKMINIVANSEKEMKIETLLKKNGYSDVVAIIGDDKSLDIVVKAPSLNAAEVAQIVDVASRQANIKINDIHVKPMY